MAHLARVRKGWENEHLGTYLLSRVGVVARPITVADDVGTDLFCALFDITERGGIEYLLPRSSMAVQLKSSARPLNLTKRLEYLSSLEIPYYLGVLDRSSLTLKLYSGRNLPHLFAYRGTPVRLRLVPVSKLDDTTYRTGSDREGYDLSLPPVITLTARDSKDDLRKKRLRLQEDAALVLKSVVSRLNEEFIFDVPGGVEIFAGQGSVQVFRENFFKRLAPVFYNLAWLAGQGGNLDSVEITCYKSIYERLVGRTSVPRT